MDPLQSSDPLHQRFTELRNALLKLHKTLLDSERDAYEHDIEKIHTSGQFLGLVMGDPWFAWLRELSQLIVVIDETQDSKKHPPTALDADRLVAQAKALLTPEENGTGFAQRYDQAMQRDPDVFIAHCQTIKLLGRIG